VYSGVSLYSEGVGLRRLPPAAAIVGLGALVFTGSAQACSCAPQAPGKAMREADAAIVGSLVKVVPRNRLQADYRYRVRRVFKRGAGIRRGRVLAVRSSRSSAACGLPQRVGRRYGLLLTRGGGRWTGGLCGLVRPRQLASRAWRAAKCDA